MSWKGSRRNSATAADARRMYIRGRKGTLRLNGLSLEQALAEARVGPKSLSAGAKKVGPLKPEIRVVGPSDVPPQTRPKPKKLVRSVGKSRSSSALHFPANPVLPPPALIDARKQSLPLKHQAKATTPSKTKKAPKSKNKSKGWRILSFDGQSRFERGMVILQGGRFESRR
jgi:hypothetical protein